MLSVSLAFLKSMADLPSEKIKKIPKFVQMLHENRSVPSLNFEHLSSLHLFSARLDSGYRAILMRRGGDYVLLRVGKHDEMYRWAEQLTNSPETIGLPIDTVKPPAAEGVVPAFQPERPRTAGSTAASGQAHELRIGGIYTWNGLRERFDWDLDKKGYYLRERGGHIVCACLRADLNPSAPWEILVGKEESHIRQAELLAHESSPIPVFVKEAVDQWEYWGKFRFDRCERDIEKFRPLLPSNRLDNTSMILYLAEVE